MNNKQTSERKGKGHVGKVIFRPKRRDCSLQGTIGILPARQNIFLKNAADKEAISIVNNFRH